MLDILLEAVLSLKEGSAPWWFYIIIAFIPFSILLAVREAFCWFTKVNGTNARLDKLDRRMKDLSEAILSMNSISPKKIEIETHKVKPVVHQQPQMTEDEFFLNKEWTKK